MRPLRALLSRLAGVFSSPRHDAELASELESNLALEIDDLVRRGLTPAEARRRALIHAGGVESAKETYRARRGFAWAETTVQDARYGLRFLRRSPGFTAAAALSLALGIGANTAIFSILDHLMLRSLPVAAPEQLVQLFSAANRPSWSYPLWEQLRDRADHDQMFSGVVASSARPFNLADQGQTDIVDGLWTSGRYFEVVGVPPLVGRTFTAANDARGGGPDGAVAVISERFWRRRFGADPAIVGRRLTVERTPFTIIGVTPKSFFGLDVGASFDVAIPFGAEPLVRGAESTLDTRMNWWIRAFARLKPGQTVEQASAALGAIHASVREATLPPGFSAAALKRYLPTPMNAKPAHDGAKSYLRDQYRDPLLAVMVVVALVLVIACVNIANLLLARADARRHELTVRLALGASRGRLVRQLLIESLLISTIGAALAVAFAQWSSRLLVSQLSTFDTVITLDLAVDWRVLAFTGGVALVVTFLFGMAPALRATRVQALDALRAHGRGATSGNLRWGMGSVLVAAQVAMCLALVFAAGLFGRTFVTLSTRTLGFDAGPVLVADLSLPPTDTRDREARLQEFDLVRRAVAALPDVTGASLSAVTPLSNSQTISVIENPDGLSLPEAEREVWMNYVSPEFFSTLGSVVVAGRGFEAADPARSTAVINHAFARKFLPGRSPVGLSVRELGGPRSTEPALTIVGVIEDAVYDSVRENVPPTMYRLFRGANGSPSGVSLAVSVTGGAPMRLSASVGAAIASTAPSLSFQIRPLSQQVDGSLVRERTVAILAGFFGVLSLALAGLGLYGVVAYSVGRRRTEIGIRLALGASPWSVIRLVIWRVALLVTVGAIGGTALSLWASKYAGALLFGLGPRDLTTLVGAVAVLAAVAFTASGLPAWRASRIDAARVLREG